MNKTWRMNKNWHLNSNERIGIALFIFFFFFNDFNGVITQRFIKCSQIKCSQICYRKTESQVHWQHYLPYFLQKKIGERGGLRPGRPKGVYQACGATQQECHGEHRQSWGHRGRGCWGLRALGQLPPHTPPQQSHTHRAALCHG